MTFFLTDEEVAVHESVTDEGKAFRLALRARARRLADSVGAPVNVVAESTDALLDRIFPQVA